MAFSVTFLLVKIPMDSREYPLPCGHDSKRALISLSQTGRGASRKKAMTLSLEEERVGVLSLGLHFLPAIRIELWIVLALYVLLPTCTFPLLPLQFSIFASLLDLFILDVWVSIYAPYAYSGCRGWKGAFDPLELELQKVGGHSVDAVSQSQVLWKNSHCS